jgi:regulatory protein
MEEALGLAYRFLGRRERTTHEVRDHLAAKGVDDALIEDTITELREQGYLDDARFARLFVEDKRSLEGWGRERIERGLRERGLDRELVEAALAGQGHEQELEQALELLERRYPVPPVDPRDHERALAVLLRKGYATDLALEALKSYIRAAGRSALR